MSGSFVPFDKMVFSMEDYPCPRCGNRTLVGLLFRDENGSHMHTFYKCMYWPKGESSDGTWRGRERCGWDGWSGWSVPEEEGSGPTEPTRMDSGLVTIKSHPTLDERIERIERTMKERGII